MAKNKFDNITVVKVNNPLIYDGEGLQNDVCLDFKWHLATYNVTTNSNYTNGGCICD